MLKHGRRARTGDTGEQLTSKALYLTTRERNELIALEEVKDALAKQVCDYANVVSEVEAITQMDAFVAIMLVVVGEGLKHS